MRDILEYFAKYYAESLMSCSQVKARFYANLLLLTLQGVYSYQMETKQINRYESNLGHF